MIAKKEKKTYTRITTDNFKNITMERKKHTLKQTNPLRTGKQKIKKTKASCVITLTMILFILKSSNC